jgi:putative PIN family toxin of toxin-antitoxin system
LKRLVVDASTLVSGVASRPGGGAPWLLLAALLDFDFEAVICPKLMNEFRDALGNKYFQERFDPDDLAEIVANVEEAGVEHEDPKEIEALLRDPDDDYLVALARMTGAEKIITGDGDLLDHAGLEPPAIDARAACRLLGLIE